MLEPNSTATQHQKHQAETQIRELEAYRKQGKFIRAKQHDISDGSQLTRHHILKAKIRHGHSLTRELQDENGILHKSQEQMQNIASRFWARIYNAEKKHRPNK